MDTSDGLADALRQLAEASGVGVRVEATAVPVSPAVGEVASATGSDPSSMVWSGGEDYELLFAVPRRARRRFLHVTGRKGLPPVTRIGVCTKNADLVIVDHQQREGSPPGRVRALRGRLPAPGGGRIRWIAGWRGPGARGDGGTGLMLLTRSLRRRIVVAAGAALGFVLLYESPIFDVQYLPDAFRRTQAETPVMQPGPPDPLDVAAPAPGIRLRFRATAYCKGRTTASGAGIRTGIAAADPDLLPVGSVIGVEGLSPRYNGIYTILDTGPRVKGRQIDIYMWNCNEALAFGRRTAGVNVVRLGWNPRTSTPDRVDPEFRRREAERDAQLAAPPQTP